MIKFYNFCIFCHLYLLNFIGAIDINTSNASLTRNSKSIDHQKFLKGSEYFFKNFQINKNSIIKTHDSRSLGAKYLNETELSSNEECLSWCWNTSNCNLAVFEEKTRGSCYLFDCGSIQDFKCRFASHAFYTSSVLQTNRNSFLLNEWKSQTSQENELVGLKEKSQHIAADIAMVQPHIQTMGSTKPDTTTASIGKVSKCRHYQFECRNNSECIAIYNVCDGIAQCPDGSDEAIELECHKSRLNTLNQHMDAVNARGSSDLISLNVDNNGSQISAKPAQNRAISPSNYILSSLNNNPNTNSKSVPYSNLNYNYPKSVNDKQQTLDENSFSRNHVQGDYNEYNNNIWGPNWNQYSLATLPEKQIDKLGLLSNNDDNQSFNNQQLQSNAKESIYWPSFKYQQNIPQENFIQTHLSASSSLSSPSSSNNDAAAYLLPNSLSLMNDGGRTKINYSQLQQKPSIALQQFSPSSIISNGYTKTIAFTFESVEQ
ncbi:manec and ldl receptor domain containing protein [Dermatophagoides farinae]|uniref:Manec and ldl receptor domain containing protein n=1 Tax=Dermatophagoides farinae TaxID=6954 RepID=A0A9D4P8H4_DERFA|nr:manec and ldl receptor domain containing protein [Dermatophagoides farinae]